MDSIFQAEFGAELAERGHLAAVTENQQRDVVDLPAHLFDGPDKQVEILLLNQTPDTDDNPARNVVLFFQIEGLNIEFGRIDRVVNDLYRTFGRIVFPFDGLGSRLGY